MKKLHLGCDVWVPAPIEEVWDFVCQPQNLAKISPPQLKMKISFDGRAVSGSRIEVFMSPPVVPAEIRWVSLIQDVVDSGDKRQFVDVQNEGPFALWKHTHSFEAGAKEIDAPRYGSPVKSKNPGTWIRDRVTYAMPFGPLGELADRAFARRLLSDNFAYRARRLRELFDR